MLGLPGIVFGLPLWRFALALFLSFFAVFSVYGAHKNGFSLPWYAILSMVIFPWATPWLIPRMKELFRQATNLKQLGILVVVAIVGFFAGDALLRKFVLLRFDYVWIPLTAFVDSRPEVEALIDFVFFAWYGVAFVPGALIWFNYELDLLEKAMAILGSLLLWLSVCAIYFIGISIALWIG